MKISKKILALSAAAALALTLTACDQTTADRSSGSGTKADDYKDASQVVVFRNADNVPNVAYFCLDGFGWASTLTGGDTGASKAAALIRFPEYDPTCGTTTGSVDTPR